MIKEERPFFWLAVIFAIAIIGACVSHNPTEPAPGGDKDEEDRDEVIITRADRAFLSSDGDSLFVFTEEFFGNPVNRVSPIPAYGIILYNEKNELLRIAFGGFYNKDNEKKEDIHPDEYLKAFVRIRYDDIPDRPLRYLNIYAYLDDEAAVEKIIRSHFSRIVLGKIEIQTDLTF